MSNCRIGDIAVVIKSPTGKNLGKIVKCIRRIEVNEIIDGRRMNIADDVVWLTDSTLTWTKKGGSHEYEAHFCRDSILKPLRDDDGDDETMIWAGKPNKKVLENQ